MNILITGGAGFIGLNLISYLLQEKLHNVVVLDNFSMGQRESLEVFDVKVYEGDIQDKKLVEAAMDGIKVVVHLAADTRVMDSIENPDFNYDVNVNGTYKLLCAARRNKIDKFIFASTGGAILGDALPPVHEEMVPRPLSPYGASKLCGEAYCSAFAGSYGLNTVALRFSNVYGPRSFHKGSVIAHFFKQIIQGKSLTVYGDGTQTRDYVYVDDLCEAVYKVIHSELSGEVFQLGSGIETSINDLLEKIRKIIGSNYTFAVTYKDFREGEIKKNYADITHAKNNLDYHPSVDLDGGLRRTWQWFLKPFS